MKEKQTGENFVGKLRKDLERLKIKWKLFRMDYRWYQKGYHCSHLFPPSFYYTHSKEEIDQITEEKVGQLMDLIEELRTQESV